MRSNTSNAKQSMTAGRSKLCHHPPPRSNPVPISGSWTGDRARSALRVAPVKVGSNSLVIDSVPGAGAAALSLPSRDRRGDRKRVVESHLLRLGQSSACVHLVVRDLFVFRGDKTSCMSLSKTPRRLPNASMDISPDSVRTRMSQGRIAL